MLKLHDLLAPTEVLLVRDEVYEHMVFDTDKGYGASAPQRCQLSWLGSQGIDCEPRW